MMITKTLNSFMCAWRGLVTVWQEERNFKIEIGAAILVLFCIFYFNFSLVESAFLILAIAFVLCVEIINTAIEDLCNKVEPNHDPIIRKIKDMSGAFVLISAAGAFILAVLVFYNHFA